MARNKSASNAREAGNSPSVRAEEETRSSSSNAREGRNPRQSNAREGARENASLNGRILEREKERLAQNLELLAMYVRDPEAERARLMTMSRGMEVEQDMDLLCILCDRMLNLADAGGRGYASRAQREMVAQATTAMQRALTVGRGPNAGGAGYPYSYERAEAVAQAYVVAESVEEVEDDLGGWDLGDVLDVEDRAGRILGEQLREEGGFTPTSRQMQIAHRVGRRLDRRLERVQNMNMPEVCILKFEEFRRFRRGDIIRGSKGKARHEFDSKDIVNVKKERDADRQRGYICHETRFTVQVMTVGGVVFQKRKENVELVERRARIIEQEDYDFREGTLAAIQR